ncbi:MAG: HAD family hydrolase [Thermomicrobiales bacterium]
MTTAEAFDPAPRAILLDLDDTLCDYTAARNLRLRLAFAAATGLPRNAPGVDALIEASVAIQSHGADHFRGLLARHGYADKDRADAAADWYRTHRFHGLELFPDSRRVLERLRRGPDGTYNRPIGIITNGPAEVQRAKIDLLKIRDLVDFVIISGEYGVEKPDPAIYAEALKLAGASAAEAVFVGDSVDADMAGAHASGLRSVWVNRQGSAWLMPWRAPDRQIRYIGELPDLVGSGD